MWTCLEHVYIAFGSIQEALESKYECTCENGQIGLNPPKWAKQAPNQPKMVTNGGVDVFEVYWCNYESLACVGEQLEVSGRLKVGNKCSNNPKMG